MLGLKSRKVDGDSDDAVAAAAAADDDDDDDDDDVDDVGYWMICFLFLFEFVYRCIQLHWFPVHSLSGRY